jgi:hypothetical protein
MSLSEEAPASGTLAPARGRVAPLPVRLLAAALIGASCMVGCLPPGGRPAGDPATARPAAQAERPPPASALLFDDRSVARAYEALAQEPRRSMPARLDAALRAAVLYARMGDHERLAAVRAALASLGPPGEGEAELEYLLAADGVQRWDERGADEGDNHAAGVEATAALEAYYAAHASGPASRHIVAAAHQLARLTRGVASGGPRPPQTPTWAGWCRRTVAAFEAYRGAAPAGRSTLGSPEADMAAECAFELLEPPIEAELAPRLDRYHGTPDEVLAAFDHDVEEAARAEARLGDVITRFGSRPWSVAVRLRQASLYDACHVGLSSARAPGLKLFSGAERQLLEPAGKGADEALDARKSALRQARREAWRAVVSQRLDAVDRKMVRLYVEALTSAMAWEVTPSLFEAAARRLTFFEMIVGHGEMARLSRDAIDARTGAPFVYRDRMFLRLSPGLRADGDPIDPAFVTSPRPSG